jgi:hypothetical protein
MPVKLMSPVGTTVTVAIPTFVESCFETAMTVSVCGVVVDIVEGVGAVGTAEGPVYTPVALMEPQPGLQVTAFCRVVVAVGSWVSCQVTSFGVVSFVNVAMNWKFWLVGTAAFAGVTDTEIPELRVITHVAVFLVLACAVAVMVTVGGEVVLVAVDGGVAILDGAV